MVKNKNITGKHKINSFLGKSMLIFIKKNMQKQQLPSSD